MSLFDADPRSALEHYFGFPAFRPLQEEIVRDVLAGRDVFALLPTGAGKSLCYQLPAVVSRGLTVVVSPLIALMKDQVDSLRVVGVSATFLNSSLEAHEIARRMQGLARGEFRLLYLAPERLCLPNVVENLANWQIERIAIDEAHCISEWGHDFRPEYRRLAEVRLRMPQVPVLALTATATERVRLDIIQQLALHDPRCYAASFNRPNLTYRVLPKARALDQLVAFVRARSSESGIVYAHSRKQVESLALKLNAAGVAARPYHAGLAPRERARAQDLFRRDDVRVICATVAFGMGIDKPNVRFVVHYDLPKNLEAYYQETGRAGRDGLPAECLLFFSGGDAAKFRAFIDEKEDENERAVARAQLRMMCDYAESSGCRRRTLLGYFGERLEVDCDNCDNCLEPPPTFDGTLLARQFLSCVVRVRQASGFGVGLNHIVDVLLGGDTEKVRTWNHDRLSTFGIGKGTSRDVWLAAGREFVRLGLLLRTAGARGALELSNAGRAVLFGRRDITLPQTVAPTKTRRAGAAPSQTSARPDGLEDALFEALRVVRRRLADERDVPAYVIFSDATLRAMARQRPTTLGGLRSVSGVGDKKLADFGAAFLAAIVADDHRTVSHGGTAMEPDGA